MEDNFKNIVVLRNLPSNIIEEAIVVIKQNKMAKNLEYVDKKNEKNVGVNKRNPKDYIVKEAEMIIAGYISKIEKQKDNKINKKLQLKYKRLKILTIIFGIISFVNIISIILK